MNFICTTCGTQYADTPEPPSHCPICEDQRQYISLSGQQWTTLDNLRHTHKTKIEAEEHHLTSFSIDTHFGIGQRTFLLQTNSGNILWDCISLLDQPTIDYISGLGGIQAIAISHPHYYTTMIEWSRAFHNAPIYLHRDDAQWVMRPDSSIEFWEGETKPLFAGLSLIRCGGHFAGASVLHWPNGAGGKGTLLSGDILQVVPDRRFVSFMWSYPNYIPLNAPTVQRIVQSVEPFAFDRIYGAFPKLTIASDGKNAVHRSAERYLKAISG